MKVRSGFVSNSSSSSFIVTLPRVPVNEKDVLDIFFNGNENIAFGWDGSTLSSEAASILYRDISRQEPNNINVISEEYRSALMDKLFPYYDSDDIPYWEENNSPFTFNEYRGVQLINPTFSSEWDLKEYFTTIYFNEHKEEYLDLSDGKVIYVLEYGNECGNSDMEDEDIFSNVTYIKNSHH